MPRMASAEAVDREAMRHQGKCPLRLHIEHRGPVATGGFPPELG